MGLELTRIVSTRESGRRGVELSLRQREAAHLATQHETVPCHSASNLCEPSIKKVNTGNEFMFTLLTPLQKVVMAPPKSLQRTSLGSAQPQPFEAALNKLCALIDNAKAKKGEIKYITCSLWFVDAR
jgi:hypothetical protein